MPTFDIPQTVIDEWIAIAKQHDLGGQTYEAGFTSAHRMQTRHMLDQMGIKITCT